MTARKDLEGRTAVVTGAARGIGFAIASQLADAGATLALLDRDGAEVEAAAARLSAAVAWSCDVSDAPNIRHVFEQIHATFGAVDILVNNAGIWRHTPVLATEEEQWDEVFAVNVKGVLFASRATAARMIEQGWGKIVNIASVAGFGGSSNWSAYCASKAASISLTLALAQELKPHNIQVQAVCPGATQTELLDRIEQAEPGSRFDWIHRPEEVAGEVVKLVVPFEQTGTGRIIPMKPPDSVLGINVQFGPAASA